MHITRRRRTLVAIATAVVFLSTPAFAQNFVASRDAPVPGQPKWVPSFAFPRNPPPASEPRPWLAVDPFANPDGYARAVLAYFMEGQNTTTWRVQENPVRKWYHMPWMTEGTFGREVIHGLTRERNATPGSLASTQTSCTQTWSIGFFNPTAAYQLWKIWNDGNSSPDFTAATMPEGAVVVKLLFNEAKPTEVPYLKGSPSFTANVAKHGAPGACVSSGMKDRAKGTVRLIQVDIAVKDSRAPVTNWFFGTFAYRNEAPGAKAWEKLVPVGLTWGNDPNLSDALAASGQKPVESIVLNKFQFTRNFGRGGRMNGPLDNNASSCMSCHTTAQKPNSAPLSPSLTENWDKAKCWFRNLPPTQAFGEEPTATVCGVNDGSLQSLDFSLQLAVGWRNWTGAQQGAQPVASQPGAPKAFAPQAASKGGSRAAMPAPTHQQPLMLDGKVSHPIAR